MLRLSSDDYGRVSKLLSKVTINHLFAKSVVEKHVDGSVFTDSITQPTAVYIAHPYGMSLLFGSPEHRGFNQELKNYLLGKAGRTISEEWLQACPASWNSAIAKLLGDRLVKAEPTDPNPQLNKVTEFSRVLFKFDPEKYRLFRSGFPLHHFDINRSGKHAYHAITGSVIPGNFWRNEDHFVTDGIGFHVEHKGGPVSMSFASFLHARELEIGIETLPEFRNRGMALAACSSLIDYCLENDYEPIWSCRLQNRASFRLAVKLGFEPTRTLPYYRLV